MTEPITTATPRCPHFGACGGCQYQDLAYTQQLRIKRARLEDLLHQAALAVPHNVTLHSSEPYFYRNRIRLRIERTDGLLRFGYNIRTTTDFLPITTCPIAAPILIQAAAALLTTAAEDRDAAFWLNATAEAELFANDDLTRVQLTLFCAPRTKSPQGSFIRMMTALQTVAPQIIGASAVAFDQRTGPTGRTLAEAGASGLNYTVAGETYWISRGGFFQVNRFLLPTLVKIVTDNRSGELAWDLYAGVGLFSRVLAQHFNRITSVEANPVAFSDLRVALLKLSPNHTAIQSTTLDFLNRAVLDRDRPNLIILDPPRAGAGLEACELLNRVAAPHLVYVSCDPATLARDLVALQPLYAITALHLIDLFPQTSHLETIVVLERRA